MSARRAAADASSPPGQHPADRHRAHRWARALRQLETLIGPEMWRRRTQQLVEAVTSSPYSAKIIADYHWIELELVAQFDEIRRVGLITCGDVSNQTAAALDFADAAVSLHTRLTERGRRILVGRLRDGLNNGLAGLFLEIDTAQHLIGQGYEVRFPDFDGTGQHDLDAVRNNLSIAIECKSISADAGRKVHRRDFYRFMELLQLGGSPSVGSSSSMAVVVTMADRFPSTRATQDEIAHHIRALFRAGPGARRSGMGFYVHAEPFTNVDLVAATSNLRPEALRRRWGANAHVAGFSVNGRWNLVIVRSARQDDTSREALAARKKAAKQLPVDRPGVIAIQYEAITVQDLVKPPFRGRLTILDAAMLQDARLAHVAGIYHCAFDGRWQHADLLGKPAVATWRTPHHADLMSRSFGTAIDDKGFAKLLCTESQPVRDDR